MPKGHKAVKPNRELLFDLYINKRFSYREIMNEINVSSARSIKKWLTDYEIPIRTGSEAVKTQWENNPERRKELGKTFSKANTGKASVRRLSDSSLSERMKELDIHVVNRKVIDGYTLLSCQCNECGHCYEMSLKNFYGCKHCITKRTHDIQRTPFNIVQEVFSNNDMVLLDDEYINIETPMSFICVNHASEGVRKRTFASVKRLGKCNLCRIEERNKDKTNDRERLNYDIKRWREAVYKRDNYTCQCCEDKKGGNLNAHHIQNFSVHKHLRFDIENGITLCKHCHNPNKKGSFHNVYGTRNNTKAQLEEYIRNHKTL